MTYNPPTLLELGAYWTAQGGVNLGVVGDASHHHGYHLGRDRLHLPDYSAQNARDVTGLSNAASAIDLGALEGSLGNMREFSVWLVERCQANADGTRDVREVIYTPPASTTVLRYDRERGYASPPRPNEADDSHLTHTHIGFYRDGEARDKVRIFAPYFASTPEGSMSGDFAIYEPQVESRKTAEYRAGSAFFNDWQMTDQRGRFGATAGRVQVLGYRGQAYAVEVGTAQGWEDGQSRPTLVFVAKTNLHTIVDVADQTPYSQADLDAAYARGRAEGDVKHTVTLSIDGQPNSTTEV